MPLYVPGMHKENILTDGTKSQNVVQGCTQCTGVCRVPCYRGATECWMMKWDKNWPKTGWFDCLCLRPMGCASSLCTPPDTPECWAGVSILQKNLNYSPAPSVICQILPQFHSYTCLLTRGIDQFFWHFCDDGGGGHHSAKWLLGCTGGRGCLGECAPLRSWNILYFWNWNRAIWQILLATNLEQAMSKKNLKKKNKNKKKNSSMDLTDPDFAFWRNFGKHLLKSLKISHFSFFKDKSEYFHLCTTLGGDDYIGHPPAKYSKSTPMLGTDP